MSESTKKLDLGAVRGRLERRAGPEYWRSLDDLAATPEFRRAWWIANFRGRRSAGAEDENPAKGRRNFLKLMGASLALAGLSRLYPAAYREHRALCQTAGGNHTRSAVVFRHREHARWRGQRNPRGEPRRAADENRRQPGTPRHAGRAATSSRKRRCCNCTIPTDGRTGTRATSAHGACSTPVLRMLANEGQERRGHPHPHRDGDLAHHGGQFRAHPATLPGHEMASVGARRTAQRASRAAHDFRAAGQYLLRSSTKANVIVALDSDFLASGAGSLRYARQYAARRRVRASNTEP